MTVPHRPERAFAPATVQAAATALRARGHRVSSARRLVLEALFAARDEPLSADEIASHTGDLASVYRNLDTLEQAGLVHHIHVGHGPGRYLLARGAGGYAVCDRCEAHVALTYAALAPVAATVRDACGFEPDFSHFAITGRCSRCVSTNQ